MHSQREEIIRQILAEKLGVDPPSITRQTTIADLNADSLDAAEIIMDLEDAFGVTIPDEDAAKWQTVGNIIDYLTDRDGEAGVPAKPHPNPPPLEDHAQPPNTDL